MGEALAIQISGLAGLYCYFLLLCDQWLADGGLAFWLIPSEFMSVKYGEAVRRYLTERVRLLQIHRFCPDDVQFPDALVSSAVVVFQKARPGAKHKTLCSLGGPMARPLAREVVAARELRTSPKWTTRPAPASSEVRQEKHKMTLGEWFEIKRGIATGANAFFILPHRQTQRLGIPKRFWKPILPSPRRMTESVIESSRDGRPKSIPLLCLIDCDRPEEEIRSIAPKFWSYLQAGKQRNIHEGYLASRRSPWYSQEQRPAAPFLCTYMGRTGEDGGKPFRFIWNQSQATAANTYLLLYPKAPLLRILEAKPRLWGELFRTLQEITTEMFLQEGRVYGGGLYKLEPKELARVSASPILAVVEQAQREPFP